MTQEFCQVCSSECIPMDVVDVNQLLLELNTLLDENGIILFLTLLSDGNIQPYQRLS